MIRFLIKVVGYDKVDKTNQTNWRFCHWEISQKGTYYRKTERYGIELIKIFKHHKDCKEIEITDDLENPAEFVKGLCHVESMTNLCKRRIIQQENIFINQAWFLTFLIKILLFYCRFCICVENQWKNTLFKTELAFDEFKHLLELDYKKEWFNEVKQIIQVLKPLRTFTQNLRIINCSA